MPEIIFKNHLKSLKLVGQKSKKLFYISTRGLSKKFDKFISLCQGYNIIKPQIISRGISTMISSSSSRRSTSSKSLLCTDETDDYTDNSEKCFSNSKTKTIKLKETKTSVVTENVNEPKDIRNNNINNYEIDQQIILPSPPRNYFKHNILNKSMIKRRFSLQSNTNNKNDNNDKDNKIKTKSLKYNNSKNYHIQLHTDDDNGNNPSKEIILVHTMSPTNRRKKMKKHLSSPELRKIPVIPHVLLTYRNDSVINGNESTC